MQYVPEGEQNLHLLESAPPRRAQATSSVRLARRESTARGAILKYDDVLVALVQNELFAEWVLGK